MTAWMRHVRRSLVAWWTKSDDQIDRLIQPPRVVFAKPIAAYFRWEKK